MDQISVCMICGNEEAVILRVLQSARPIMTELCLARAVGDQEPDRTAEMAREWCDKNGVNFRFSEYKNSAQFPHVDDFGAARNLSFSLATQPWVMWLDCDDTLTPEACDKIAKLNGESAVYYFGYRKPDGSTCPRERLFKTGVGRWKNRIHETFAHDGFRGEQRLDIEILHSPLTEDRPQNHARNEALLELQLEDVDRHLFYLHCEQFKQGDGNAIATGKAALELLPPEKSEEKYTILVHLAQLDGAKAEFYAMEAMKLHPFRRDALAVLCQHALSHKNLPAAVSYFRMMDALPDPSPLPWSHCALWHGAGRNYLRVKLLRAAGNNTQADVDHARYMQSPEYAEMSHGH